MVRCWFSWCRGGQYWRGLTKVSEEEQTQKQSTNCFPYSAIVIQNDNGRLHIDLAINFLGFNWLVITDAYTKYPCNAVSISEVNDQTLARGFRAFRFSPYSCNRLRCYLQIWRVPGVLQREWHCPSDWSSLPPMAPVQTFKQALRKSDKAPKDALQDFLRNYRRTPLSTGYLPSELLNERQIRTKIDTLLPSPAHTAQGKQAKGATKSQQSEHQLPVTQVAATYKVGDSCYALYFGPRRDRDPRWVPAIVVNVLGPAVSTCVWLREVQSGDAT